LILSLRFSPDTEYLVAGDSLGKISVWKLESILSPHHWIANEAGPSPEPHYTFKASNGPIYSLLFYENGRNTVLLCGGDQNITIWEWNKIVDILNQPHQSLEPLFSLINPQRKGTRLALSPVSETNALDIDLQTGYLISAAGDNNAYIWDLQQNRCVGTLEGHHDYLHCLRVGQQTAFTGSEDGTVRIWDLRALTTTAILDPMSGTTIPTFEQKTSTGWVGCLDVDSYQNWLVCGSDNLLSVWYLPMLSVTSYLPTSGTPQAVIFESIDDSVISVGNETYLYHWKTTGELKMRVPSSSKSLFSVALNKPGKNKVLATCGASPLIDIYTNYNSKAFSCNFNKK